MIRASYGAIVEGEYDVGVFEELFRKICPYPVEVSVKGIGGMTRLMPRFPRWLRMFEHCTTSGGAVDRALVIRDANGEPVAAVEARMRAKIAGLTYDFRHGVEVHAVKQETETWLLADAVAIGRVAGRAARSTPGPLEDVQHPKEVFMDVLNDVGLRYTPEVCRRIAREIDLGTLRHECPSFVLFEQKVRLVSLLTGH